MLALGFFKLLFPAVSGQPTERSVFIEVSRGYSADVDVVGAFLPNAAFRTGGFFIWTSNGLAPRPPVDRCAGSICHLPF